MIAPGPLRGSLFFMALVIPAAAQSGFPFQDESLNYSVNWPSGLSLGEAHLSARHAVDRWDLEMSLEAGIPGFAIADKFHSTTNMNQCSIEFERTTSHGPKKSTEKTAFDSASGKARRVTSGGGGQTDFAVSACPRDALAYLYFARKELGQGRVPPREQVYFGSAYSVRMEYAGAEKITVAETQTLTDRVTVHFQGPASNSTFDIFFARDAARTPLVIRVPTSLGAVSMELVH